MFAGRGGSRGIHPLKVSVSKKLRRLLIQNPGHVEIVLTLQRRICACSGLYFKLRNRADILENDYSSQGDTVLN